MREENLKSSHQILMLILFSDGSNLMVLIPFKSASFTLWVPVIILHFIHFNPEKSEVVSRENPPIIVLILRNVKKWYIGGNVFVKLEIWQEKMWHYNFVYNTCSLQTEFAKQWKITTVIHLILSLKMTFQTKWGTVDMDRSKRSCSLRKSETSDFDFYTTIFCRFFWKHLQML